MGAVRTACDGAKAAKFDLPLDERGRQMKKLTDRQVSDLYYIHRHHGFSVKKRNAETLRAYGYARVIPSPGGGSWTAEATEAGKLYLERCPPALAMWGSSR